MELKKTLLMPRTNFEMRGNLAIKEPNLVKSWKENQLYNLMLKKNEGKPTYILHDGPPYANGNIHCGHMLNRILKDFVVRYKNMSGFHTPFIFGWDTHGLPIENVITKSGVNRKLMETSEFRKLCEAYAIKQVNLQKEQIRRLGVVGDFDHPYLTLQPEYEAHQLEVFKTMALKDLIFRGKKPVHWSPSSESALAEAEIEYADVTSHAIYVSFDVIDGKDVLTSNDKFVIWTTTPWTLPANLAISVHPYFNYGLYESSIGNIVLLDDLVATFEKDSDVKVGKKIKEFKGKELEFITTKHPLYPRTSVVILGEHVTAEAGTGAVHTAPGHGVEDFNVGQKYDLEVLCPVDERGIMTSEAGKYAGMFYEKANDPILEDLKAVGALVKDTLITHSYPHDWRTNKPLIFRATPQWFASIEPIRTTLLNEIEKVNFTPSWGKIRISNMIKDRGDWCISRQRAWGVPIPIIFNEDKSPIIDEKVFDHIIDIVRKQGSNAWYTLDVTQLLPQGYTNPASPNGKFYKEVDTMDVWFDSGSSATAVLKGRGFPYPSDLYLEGNDQYRGWFNSSLIIAVATNGIAPYKNVVSHGFVMDENWDKMSKSKGNGIDPLKIADVYGADILRLWAASINYQDDVRISENLVKQVSETYRKIRNTFKFMLGNLSNGEQRLELETLDNVQPSFFIDNVILAKLEEVKNKVLNHFEKFEFSYGLTALVNFITVDLSSFYLDISKDVLYCETSTSKRRISVQKVIYDVTITLMKLLTPILSFTMDEVYTNLDLNNKLFNVQLLDLPTISKNNQELLDLYSEFNKLRDKVLASLEEQRAQGHIGSSQQASIKVKVGNKALFDKLNELDKDELARLFVVSNVEIEKDGANDVTVVKNEFEKCERCWNHKHDVKKHGEHNLCERCAKALVGLKDE